MAQVHRMMGHNAEAWSIYRCLLNEYFDVPDEDDYDAFSEIATELPFMKSESAIKVWYPNIFDYLEYVYTRCQETPADKLTFNDILIQRYRSLGHAYW